MRPIFIAVLAVSIIACNTAEKTTPEETKSDSTAKPSGISNMSGYTPTYSASFAIGDAKNAETILALWNAWDEGDLGPTKQLFADSVTFYFSDGSEMKGTRDSTTASAQAYRNNFSAVKSTMHAIFPLESTDKNEDWVCIWGTEVRTDKKGKTDSVHLQETWRFNSGGKVDLLYQYSQVAAPQKAGK
jgi:ketosteroid isomerase-like protein